MSEVKLIISALCKVLSSLSEEVIKAEHLRLAKFNKVDEKSVVHLWNLLHKLCCISHKKDDMSLCKGEPRDIATCVKMFFAFHSYDSFLFYCLPIDMSAGSRELLLAFGWLLASTNVLEIKMIEYVKNKLFKEGSSRHSSKENSLQSASCFSVTDKIDNENNQYNSIIWHAGRIHFNLRYILNMTSERNKLIKKVHTGNEDDCNIPFLTLEQLELLKNPDRLPLTSDEIKHLILVLDSYMYFIKKNKIFWDWMESVVAEDGVNNNNSFDVGNDFLKFIIQLKSEIKNEVMDEKPRNFNTNKIFQLSFLKNISDDNPFLISLSEIDKEIKLLNGSIKRKEIDINKMLENLKMNNFS